MVIKFCIRIKRIRYAAFNLLLLLRHYHRDHRLQDIFFPLSISKGDCHTNIFFLHILSNPHQCNLNFNLLESLITLEINEAKW